MADHPTISGAETVSFSAVVHPNGRATTAYFEFGLDARYRGTKASGVVYAQRTPAVHLGSGFGAHVVSGTLSGLVPNALYHVRLVASSSAGTVYSRDVTFMTAKDPAPPLPVIGKTANVEPVSGLVFVERPRGKSPHASEAGQVESQRFVPLTETRQLPIGSQIDARTGALQVVVATAQGRHTQRATIAGGLFSLSQTGYGLAKGLTTVDLLENDFPGAPTYRSCSADTAADASGPDARTAQLSSQVLQTLHARDYGGRFRIQGRYSAGTARDTVWATIDRCDGTLTMVNRGTVNVFDLVRRATIAVHAGQHYLAQAP